MDFLVVRPARSQAMGLHGGPVDQSLLGRPSGLRKRLDEVDPDASRRRRFSSARILLERRSSDRRTRQNGDQLALIPALFPADPRLDRASPSPEANKNFSNHLTDPLHTRCSPAIIKR
jgi:hypothetical protein